MRDKITPDGTKDIVLEEYNRYLAVKETLMNLFRMQGYEGVMTPTLEYYDVFVKSTRDLQLDLMYKLMDEKGRLLVLCPDCTIPVARLLATRFKDREKPLRLYYHHNIYQMDPEKRGKPIEMSQMGVELIGGNQWKSDYEIVELAATCIQEIVGETFQLELCHIGYFKAIMDSMKVEDEIKEEIHRFIEQKNYAALANILEPYKEEKAAKALLQLPRLFGGMEVIEKAYTLFDENGAKESLDYLKQVYRYAKSFCNEKQVIVDLGLVNQADYYTGIIFRGYVSGVGEPVLSGGRYDQLLGKFGEDSKAIGFGMNVDLASKVICYEERKVKEVLVFTEEERYAIKSLKYQKELRKEGIVAIPSVFERIEEVVSYAKKRNIREIHIVGEEIQSREVE